MNKKRVSPYLIIFISYIFVILIGTLLLMLPFSYNEEKISFIDALFVATSALTTTGHTTINLSNTLSLFGKIILGLLIQIGGLGIITISVFVMILIGTKIGITNRILVKENLGQVSLKGIIGLVKKIVLTTLIIEFVGILINLIFFIPIFGFYEGLGYSIFHVISSFNNAGFNLFGPNISLINNNIGIYLNSALMVMLGGIGFIVIHDLIDKKSYKKLTRHSKIVLKVNIILWTFGTMFFMLVDKLSFINSFYLSVTSRSNGFVYFNPSLISNASILILIFLMFVGSSPSSTGGGIKTTTLYTVSKGILELATGKKARSYQRVIDDESKNKAYVLFIMTISIILLSTIFISMIEESSIKEILFSTTSALGNVGIQFDFMENLRLLSKTIFIFLMFIGKIGPLTLIALINKRWYNKGQENITYIEEKIMIG